MKIDSVRDVRDDISRKAGTARDELDALMWIMRMAVIGSVVGAIWVELQKPAEERTFTLAVEVLTPTDERDSETP